MPEWNVIERRGRKVWHWSEFYDGYIGPFDVCEWRLRLGPLCTPWRRGRAQ